MTKKIAPKAPVLLTEASAIQKAIASIKTKGANLDASIQIAARSVLDHISQHSNTTLADQLFQAMPNGSRRNCLAEYLLAFGNIRLLLNSQPGDKEALKAGRIFAIDRTKKYDAAGAEAKVWHEMRKQADVQTVFDCQAAVQSLLNRIQKAVSNGMTIEGQQEALAILQSALNTQPVKPEAACEN